MTTQPETFDQFYARISANRKAEILACTDPVKREELQAWDQHFEAKWRAGWQIEEASKDGFQSERDYRRTARAPGAVPARESSQS